MKKLSMLLLALCLLSVACTRKGSADNKSQELLIGRWWSRVGAELFQRVSVNLVVRFADADLGGEGQRVEILRQTERGNLLLHQTRQVGGIGDDAEAQPVAAQRLQRRDHVGADVDALQPAHL